MRRTYLWPLMIGCSAVLISLPLIGDNRSRGQNGDIIAKPAEASESFVFQLELGSQGVVAEYAECFGLGSSNEIEESVIEKDAGAIKQKTPGALEWHNITLRRKGAPDAEVWAWRKAMEDGKTDDAFRGGSVIMFKAGSAEPLARWTFSKGWAASLTIQGSAEELTIVHDGLQRVAPSSPGSRKRP